MINYGNNKVIVPIVEIFNKINENKDPILHLEV